MADTLQTVSIDGKEYPLDQLSENARNQLSNLRACDEEIARLQRQFVIAQGARVAFSNALRDELPAAKKASGGAAKSSAKSTTKSSTAKSTAKSSPRSKKSAE